MQILCNQIPLFYLYLLLSKLNYKFFLALKLDPPMDGGLCGDDDDDDEDDFEYGFLSVPTLSLMILIL